MNHKKLSQRFFVEKPLSLRNAHREHERWSRSQLEEYQRKQLGSLVEYVTSRSAFFREHYGGTLRAQDVVLGELPVTNKAHMMDHFEAYVTVQGLRHQDLETHISEVSDDDLYTSEYRVMASSGSSGRKGLYVFDRPEWVCLLATILRWTEMMGVKPTLPRRTKIAAVGAPDAKHMTYRGAASIDVGLFKTLRLSATEPMAQLVAKLNEHQPDYDHGLSVDAGHVGG